VNLNVKNFYGKFYSSLTLENLIENHAKTSLSAIRMGRPAKIRTCLAPKGSRWKTQPANFTQFTTLG
jgi:hypothetical protein